MRSLALIFLVSCVSAFASPLAINAYEGTTSQSPVKQGAKEIIFHMISFSGTIGNATFSNVNQTVDLAAAQDGDRLNDIPYTVTSGNLYIIDLR